MSLNFLFTSWEGGGNMPTILTLARELIALGHRVRILGDDMSAPEILRSGAEFRPWRLAPNRRDPSPEADPVRDWEAPPEALLGIILDVCMVGPAAWQARDVIQELEREPADLIVANDMQLGGILGAEAKGIPSVVLGSNLPFAPREGVPPFGPGFLPAANAEEEGLHAAIREQMRAALDQAARGLNFARSELGLAPVESMEDLAAVPCAHLIACASSFDYPGAVNPATMEFIGPLLGKPGWSATGIDLPDDDRPESDRPFVLASLSTTFQNQADTLRRIVDALDRLDVDAVVTTGPACVGAVDGTGRVRVLESAPHDELIARSDFVISRCGHGTLMRALSAGKPVLCLPMGRDQNDNAARVAWHGAGIQLDAASPAEEIAAAAQRLLDEPQWREGAERIGARIVEETDSARAVRRLVELASAVGNGEMLAA